MRVREIMTQDPACCTPDTNLQDVARMMVDCDCGEIPVIQSHQDPKPIGVVTDRDIACRAVAQGKNPLQLKARDILSRPPITVTPDTNVEDCCKLMEQKQVRRVLVVDQAGACCGIVAQADIARVAPEHDTVEVVRDISQPGGTAFPA